MNWHEENLDAKAKVAADRLSRALDKTFYLAGGTGLSLQIGHRISLDLELFSFENHLEQSERENILASLKKNFLIREEKDRTLHLGVGGTSVSLFHYSYSMLVPPKLKWRGLAVADPLDIGLMKMSAILGRGSRKDFIDLYWICQKHPLLSLFDVSKQKFPYHRDFPAQAARALTYFTEAEVDTPLKSLKKVDWKEVKRYFSTETPKVLKTLMGR